MKKLILLLPYAMYQFLKKRGKTERIAYINSLALLFMILMIYFQFLFPQVTGFVYKNYFYDYIHEEFSISYRAIQYMGYILFQLLIYMFIRKKTLDNLSYSKMQIKIAYVLLGILFCFPPLFLIINIIILLWNQ